MSPRNDGPRVILICGSRDWTDPVPITRVLERLPVGSLVVHGGARGADMIAAKLAHEMGYHAARVDALWDVYKKAAGPRRNAAMGLLLPAVACVYAFPLGEARGTSDMLARARKAGARVTVYRDGAFDPPLYP